MPRRISIIAIAVTMLVSIAVATSAYAADEGKTYKVFIFAGQSNAQGKAHIATAKIQAEMPETKDYYKGRYQDGDFVVRDDVFFRYPSQGPEGTYGPLKIGVGSFRFGADFEFASMMGDHFAEPVVISKTAYGGNALRHTFRPPSAGLPSEEDLRKELENAQKRITQQNAQRKTNHPLPTMEDITAKYGMLYRQILDDYKEVTINAAKYFPELKGRKPELAGIVWFQGWNDQYGGAEEEYASNLKHLISDLRRDLNAPNLPFVVVAMGQNGSRPANGPMKVIQDAQMAVNDIAEYQRNVIAFRSDLLVDKKAEQAYDNRDKDPGEWKKYGADAAYHYYGSPIWYTRIGRATGDAMLKLLEDQDQ